MTEPAPAHHGVRTKARHEQYRAKLASLKQAAELPPDTATVGLADRFQGLTKQEECDLLRKRVDELEAKLAASQGPAVLETAAPAASSTLSDGEDAEGELVAEAGGGGGGERHLADHEQRCVAGMLLLPADVAALARHLAAHVSALALSERAAVEKPQHEPKAAAEPKPVEPNKEQQQKNEEEPRKKTWKEVIKIVDVVDFTYSLIRGLLSPARFTDKEALNGESATPAATLALSGRRAPSCACPLVLLGFTRLAVPAVLRQEHVDQVCLPAFRRDLAAEILWGRSRLRRGRAAGRLKGDTLHRAAGSRTDLHHEQLSQSPGGAAERGVRQPEHCDLCREAAEVDRAHRAGLSYQLGHDQRRREAHHHVAGQADAGDPQALLYQAGVLPHEKPAGAQGHLRPGREACRRGATSPPSARR